MNKSTLALAIAAFVLAQHAVADGFLDDSKAVISSRTMYLRNANPNSSGSDQSETAEGLKLDYLSGFTAGPLGFGLDAVALQGINLDGGIQHSTSNTTNTFVPVDSDGTPVHNWSRLAANAKARYSKTEVHVGSGLSPNLPILVANDGRLLPQTFQGTTVTSKEIDNLTLNAGQFDRATSRASSNATGLAVAGGNKESNLRYAGGDWKPTKDLTLQYYYAQLSDYYKQNFLGLLDVIPVGEGQTFKTDLRYFRSTADGKNGDPGYVFNNNGGYASTPGEVDNTTWSAAFTYTLGGSSFMLGHQQVSDAGGTVYLNQGNVLSGAGRNEGNGGASVYLITDVMANSFIRAGENTTFGQYGYDFAPLGVPGLTASVLYLHGDDIRSATPGGPRASEWERDARIDYVVQSGLFKGFGASVREGSFRSGIANVAAVDQARVIFSYSYAIF